MRSPSHRCFLHDNLGVSIISRALSSTKNATFSRGAGTCLVLGGQAVFSKLSGISLPEISLGLHVRVSTTSHSVKTYMYARSDNTQISVSQHELQVRMFHLFLLHLVDLSIA